MRIHPAERYFRFFTGLVIFAGVLAVFIWASKLVAFMVIALVTAYILAPLINYLESFKLPRAVTSFLTIISILVLGVFASRTMLPLIGSQLAKLSAQLDQQTIVQLARLLESKIKIYVVLIQDGFLEKSFLELYTRLFEGAAVTQMMNNILDIFTNLFYALLIVPVTVFFLLRDGVAIEKAVLRLVPNAYFETTLTLVSKIERSLGRYLKGVLFQSVMVAALMALLLSFAGLKNALAVGVVLGITNVVPYFGPLIGDLIAISVSIVEAGNLSMVAPVFLAVLITKAVDNVIFQPLIFSRSAEMHPIVILVVVLVAAEVGGILAMLFAVPVATILKITFEQINWTFKNYRVFRSYG